MIAMLSRAALQTAKAVGAFTASDKQPAVL